MEHLQSHLVTLTPLFVPAKCHWTLGVPLQMYSNVLPVPTMDKVSLGTGRHRIEGHGDKVRLSTPYRALTFIVKTNPCDYYVLQGLSDIRQQS